MSMTPSTSRAVATEATKPPSFGAELATKAAAFKQALPPGINPEKFSRIVMTAVQRTPDLLKADRQSLWNACVQAAADGLIPDGREGALVVYKTKKKDADGRENWVEAVQFLPMVAGIKKRVRQSGEIATWDAYVVHKKDDFDFALGDNPFIHHKPFMDGDPGPIIAAYSVATLKTGEKSREVMTKTQLDRVKAASKTSGFGPWKDWESEMCRKTVVKRHAKSLPMSTDVQNLVDRDNDFATMEAVPNAAPRAIPNPLSDDAPALPAPDAPDWPTLLDDYSRDLADADTLDALDRIVAEQGALFTDAPDDVRADAKRHEAGERARVKGGAK